MEVIERHQQSNELPAVHNVFENATLLSDLRLALERRKGGARARREYSGEVFQQHIATVQDVFFKASTTGEV
jgi:hypothetical protein